RAGRIGVLGMGSGSALRALSVGAGLTAEVSTFELSNRLLQAENRNLWRWSGPGGLRQGLLQSLLNFGALKGAGRLARGQNLIAQHLFQDSARVLGHRTAGSLGIIDRPAGSLAEQFLHAEAMNLQIGAGMALAQHMAPGLHSLERGLELTLRSQGTGLSRSEPSLTPRGFKLAPSTAEPLPLPTGSRPQDFILTMSVPEDSNPRSLGGRGVGEEGPTDALQGYKSLFDYCHDPAFKDFRKLFRALDRLEKEAA